VRCIQPAEILIISNQSERYPLYADVSIYPDLIGDQGPLGGILTALKRAQHEYGVVIGCDMPYLNPALLNYMVDLAQSYDAVVPRLRGQVQGMHALYHKSCLPVIRRRLERQQLSLTGLILELNVRYIDEAEYAHLDSTGRSFTNINTPEELQAAQNR
jgi:molybdopterin-guanine dinucleotide biosynthesis protein A